MPDEPLPNDPQPEPVVEPVAEPEPVAVEPEPHPLEPGGKRFDEVYRDMKEAQRRAEAAERRAAEAEAKHAQSPQQTEKFYSAQELQSLVDAGRITPAVMADQIAYQRVKEAEQRQAQVRQTEVKQQTAMSEVRAFMEKIPALSDTTSSEFGRVAQEAYRIADETGLPTSDARVQRLALRAVYGPPEKVANTRQARENERRSADTYAETGRAGGVKVEKDPLKDVPQHYKDHWKRLNYTKERMIEESKYITPRTRRA